MKKNFIILLLLIATIFLAQFINEYYFSNNFIIPFFMIALIGGIVFEYIKISDSFVKTLKTLIYSSLISLGVFLPAEGDLPYTLQHHLQLWPYAFCMVFIVMTIADYKDKITPRINGGITLIQSLAVIYLLIYFGFWHAKNIVNVGIIIALLFSLFSIYYAFKDKILSKSSKFILRLWNSLVIMALAIYNVYTVSQMGTITTLEYTPNHLLFLAQYFLLGVSSIYFIYNFFTLISLIPGPTGHDGEFQDDQREGHIQKFSDVPIDRTRSFIIVMFAILIFTYNYFTTFLPPNFIVWIMLLAFPVIINTDQGIQEPKEN